MAWEHAFSQHMLDLALSEEDVEELRSERSIKQTSVTLEDIEALSVDENLSPYDRLVYVLGSGRDVQKVHAINHMYGILKGESREKIDKVLVLFKEVLLNSVKDVQIAGAKFLSQICENNLINGEKFALHFSKDLLNNAKEKDPEICEEWVGALIGSLNIIPKRFINEIVMFLKSGGSLTQPMNIRLLCCKLVAHVSKLVDAKRLSSDMIPVIKSLCQDIDLDVRACMCAQLLLLASYIGDDVIKDVLLPELTLLLQDEETSVRLVALETLAKVIAIVPPLLIATPRVTTITVMFYSKAVEKCISSELIGGAHFIGEIISCPGFLDDEEKASLIDSYKCLCSQGIAEGSEKVDTILDGVVSGGMDGSAECRYWCSYNFPAILVSTSLDKVSDLIPLFLSLIKDSHPAVRKPMACSFHEVAKLIIDNNITTVYEAFVLFLNDKDVDVIDGVLQGLQSTLRLLVSCTSVQNIANLVPNLLECEQCLSQSLRWRVHKKFLENIFHLAEFLSSDEISLKLVPVMFSILNGNKVIPVKLAAGKTLLHFTKQNGNIDERNEICTTLEEELAHSKSKASRILYLDLCHYVSELFSKSFFKEKFYSAAMELASDPVVNVRLKFCETLPLLKSQIRLPCDRLLLQTLEQTVRRIMAMDNDRDVSNAIRQAITEMDNIRLSMDGTPQTEEDKADQRKEEEEESQMEEHLQSKVESITKLTARCQRSDSLLDKGQTSSRRSLASIDSSDKLINKGHQKLNKTTSGSSKLNLAKKVGKHSTSKDGQSSKVSGKGSSTKLHTSKR